MDETNKKISSDDKLEAIKEALWSFYNNDLSEFATIVAINMIVNPVEPSEDCIKWARESIKASIRQWQTKRLPLS